MSTLGEVVNALRACVDRLPFTELADALDAAEEAQAYIEQVAAGSGQGEFHQVSDSFRQAVEGIGDLQQRLTAIQRDVIAVANRLESGGRTTGPPPSAQGVSAARVAELPAALPVRSRANRKTSASSRGRARRAPSPRSRRPAS